MEYTALSLLKSFNAEPKIFNTSELSLKQICAELTES